MMRVDENATVTIKDMPFMKNHEEDSSCDSGRYYEPNYEIWQNGYSTCLKEVRHQVEEAAINHNNGWINIKDSLPTPGQSVLVRVQTQCRVVHKVAEYTINRRWQGVRGNEITHWQPLPGEPIK